jgi:hypothetical protein
MALGIKKITESVVEDDRSLIMLGKLNNDSSKIEFDDNKAVPIGAIISDANTTGSKATLRVKSDENKQVRIDAHTTLAPLSIQHNELNKDSVITEKIKNAAIIDTKLAKDSVITDKIKNAAVTEPKLAVNSVTESKIANGAVVESKINNNAVTTSKIKNDNVTRDKLSSALRSELDGLRKSITDLDNRFKSHVAESDEKFDQLFNKVAQLENDIRLLRSEMNTKLQELENKMRKEINDTIDKYNLKNAVIHHNYDIVGNKVSGKYTSTPLSDISCTGNITCSGDINGKRVYFMTYQDLAEAYVPGESLEPGTIVAIHADGKVYKAESTNDCIVGVISNEYANCLGASKEELFNGSKVAVGMIGKVHVKVKGPVRIGQRINVSLANPGVGMANWMNGCNNIGQALETIDCDFDEIHEVLVQIRPM